MAALTIRFSGMQQASDTTLGPFRVVRISGNFMRAGVNDNVVAAYARHQWQTGKGYFASYECRGPLVAWFEDLKGTPSERFGPFELVRVADGTLYAESELFAKFVDESVLWHSLKLETWWPTLVMEAAP